MASNEMNSNDGFTSREKSCFLKDDKKQKEMKDEEEVLKCQKSVVSFSDCLFSIVSSRKNENRPIYCSNFGDLTI